MVLNEGWLKRQLGNASASMNELPQSLKSEIGRTYVTASTSTTTTSAPIKNETPSASQNSQNKRS